MDLIDDPILVHILKYVCRCTEYNICWTETCKLQLVCKKWNDIIKYLKNGNVIRKRICNGILNWHDTFEMEIDVKLYGLECIRNYRHSGRRFKATEYEKDRFFKVEYENNEASEYDGMAYFFFHQKIEQCYCPYTLNKYNEYSLFDQNDINSRHAFYFVHKHDIDTGICTDVFLEYVTTRQLIKMFEVNDKEITKLWEPFYTG